MSSEGNNNNLPDRGAQRKRAYRAKLAEPPNLHGDDLASNFLEVKGSSEFLEVLDEEGEEGVVVLMGASISVPVCSQMRGILNEIAREHENVAFLEVDVDKNRELAETQKLETVPTFVVYKGKKPVQRVEGAFPQMLKEVLAKITGQKKERNGRVSESEMGEDLVHYIDMKKSECLNCSDETPFEDFVARKGRLESDCDSELILCYGFNQDMTVHGFTIKAPADKGPRCLTFFVNQADGLDFDDVKSFTATQEIRLSKEDLLGEKTIELDRWKFKKVFNVTVYIAGSQDGDSDVTSLDELTFFGEPVDKKRGISGRSTQIVTLS